MTDPYTLLITDPASDEPMIDYRRHFTVSGKIQHKAPVPEDAVLTVKLLDDKGQVVRYARQEKKNNPNIYVYHPQLTCYNEEIDPGRERLKKFGFAELMVKDMEHPQESLRDATIKCFYSDDVFKAIIVSGTDTAHGMVFDDGIGYVDEHGNPYEVLPKGKYQILVELTDHKGGELAHALKQIKIAEQENRVICRFNPWEHRVNMMHWSKQMGFAMMNDVLPGYLDAYTEHWFYHMGLLPMYRANDIALYMKAKVHMFVYLVEPSSTSYETELAFLQTQNAVGNPERFQAYYYDIGEALIGKGKSYEQRGKIVHFQPDDHLDICRVDVVNEKARENVFNLNEEALLAVMTDLSDLRVHVGDRIAITGVVKPWQLDGKYFRLKDDNTYEIMNSVSKLHYVFDDGIETREFTRELMMERIDEESIGCSVYEFYNIFSIEESMAGKCLRVGITVCDLEGENPLAKDEIRIHVEE